MKNVHETMKRYVTEKQLAKIITVANMHSN